MAPAVDAEWAEIDAVVRAAPRPVKVLPRHTGHVRTDARRGLPGALAAVITCTSGLLIDSGWLRLLGGGGGALPSVDAASDPGAGFLVVGYDVVGGVFAMDAGALGDGDGSICYFAPDALAWEPLEIDYRTLLHTMLTGGSEPFYEAFRWSGWETEVSAVPLTHGLSLFPPLWTREGKDPAVSSRRAVPFGELLSLQNDIAMQIGAATGDVPLPGPPGQGR